MRNIASDYYLEQVTSYFLTTTSGMGIGSLLDQTFSQITFIGIKTRLIELSSSFCGYLKPLDG